MRTVSQKEIRLGLYEQNKRIIGVIGLFFLLHFTVQAQDTLSQQKRALTVYKNSISLSSFILFGSIQVNYERLLGERHGILTEGFYAFSGESEGTIAVSVAYRYHFKASLDGMFASAFYRWGDVYLEAEFDENGMENSYQMQTTQNLVGAGLGYRKQWFNGLAVVVRAGYGYQIGATYHWQPSEPLNQSDRERAEALRGLDFEISVGYSF